MTKHDKIPANALFIVVVMSLIIGLMCTALFMFYFFYHQRVNADLTYRRMDLNVQSVITWLLHEPTLTDTSFVMDLYDQEEDSVRITTKHWGMLDAAFVEAYTARQKAKASMLYGYLPDSSNRDALYLTDGKYLTLNGKTLLRGRCFIPQKEIRRGNLEGHYFTGNRLIEGSIMKSETSLPLLNKKMIEPVISWLENGVNIPFAKVFSMPDKDSLIQSFGDTLLVINSKGRLKLENQKLQGNILIYSDKEVVIASTCILKDVIIVAPAITIENNYHGSFQAFASDSINVGKKCLFEYPTVIGLIKTDYDLAQPSIKIGEESTLNGFVFSFANVSDIDKTLISVGDKSNIHGIIYADGFLELKPGTKVSGQVYAGQFRLKTDVAIYQNNLLDVRIDRTAMSPYFVSSSLLPVSSKKQIVKWIE